MTWVTSAVIYRLKAFSNAMRFYAQLYIRWQDINWHAASLCPSATTELSVNMNREYNIIPRNCFYGRNSQQSMLQAVIWLWLDQIPEYDLNCVHSLVVVCTGCVFSIHRLKQHCSDHQRHRNIDVPDKARLIIFVTDRYGVVVLLSRILIYHCQFLCVNW